MRHSAVSSWPSPLCRVDVDRRAETEGQWQEPPVPGSLFPYVFNACFWLVTLLMLQACSAAETSGSTHLQLDLFMHKHHM